MGVNPTLPNFKALTFDGVSSRDYGVYISGEGVFNAPERNVEMVEIPGRNGAFALDKGNFNNIEVTYPAGIFADNQTDFAEAISDFRNYLCSRNGYVRLTDDYNPDEYRLAVYKSGLEVTNVDLIAGQFDITFDCKPQRYLAIGEELVEIGAWGNTETVEGEIATFTAESDTAIKSLVADINPVQDLNGYDSPWVGGAGKNKLNNDSSSTTHNGVTFTVNADGTINTQGTATGGTAVFRIYTANSSLPSEDVILNGCPSGGDYNNGYSMILADSIGANLGEYIDTGSGATYTSAHLADANQVQIIVRNGTNVSGKIFKPMIRLSSVADGTFAPYSNICPISGWSEVNSTVCGKNLFDKSAVSTGKWLTTTTGLEENAPNYCVSDYIPVENGKTVFIPNSSTARRWFYDKNKTPKTYLNNSSDQAYTPTEDGYIRVSILVNGSGAKDVNTYQIEYGSSATTYEAYNGTTKTTTLGSTVYVGTLDVVSGVLTTEYGYVDMGDINWQYSSANTRFYATISDKKPYSSATSRAKLICSIYPFGGSAGMGGTIDSYVLYNRASANDNQVMVKDERFTDAQSFKTAVTGQTLVYELATPTTTQLTPQQVQTLLGNNNVFADSGNVKVEYGHNPIMLTNPTYFPSRPLLEVYGHGTVNLGSRSISVTTDPIGQITVFSGSGNGELCSIHQPLTASTQTEKHTTTFDDSLLVSGDPITVGYRFWCDFLTKGQIQPYTGPINVTGVFTSESWYRGNGGETEPNYNQFQIVPYFSADFVYGTSATKTGTTSVTVSTYDQDGYFVANATFDQSLSIEYDGDDKIKFTLTTTTDGTIGKTRQTTPKPSRVYQLFTANSSYPASAQPTYIDLDTGEAYGKIQGEWVNLNNHVSIPAELPTLESGNTEVTYDNTITKVEVEPRWWKV